MASRVVIVTGASSGIGAATAKLFADNGASVVITARSLDKLQKVASVCSGKAHIVTGDITDTAVQKKIVDETVNKFGRIDVLVNNAGASVLARVDTGLPPSGDNPLEAMVKRTFGVEAFDEQMNLNVRSVVGLTANAIPHLVKSKGCIVSISSGASRRPGVTSSLYCMSKAALDMFTYSMCLELSPLGVRVNSVNPGATRTAFADVITGDSQGGALLEAFAKQHHVTGEPANPEDIANAIFFLADSEKARMITGHSLHVDGGFMVKV